MNPRAGWLPCFTLLFTAGIACGQDDSSTARTYTGPAMLSLSDRDRQKLADGRRVFLDLPIEGSGKLKAVVFRVAAPPSAVWDTIRAFPSYATWIRNVARAEVYAESGQNIFVEFQIRHWLIGRINYSVKHVYPWPDASWGTFSLDDNRDSDLESASGLWRTYAVAGNPRSTDVLYAANLVAKRGTARLFRRQIGKAGLVSATQWLTREAQKQNVTN